MSEMKVSNLNVDLLQDQATVALFQPVDVMQSGKSTFTAVNVQVPLHGAVTGPESNLKRVAVDAARRALEEALEVLNTYAT